MEQIWDNLKIAITIVAAVGPVVIAILAIRFSRLKKRLSSQYETNQKLTQKRIEVYDRVGPKFNDIVSFFCYTGNWKDLTPEDIMTLKRDLDKEIQINMPHFSDELIEKYNALMQLCFVAFTGWEHNEKIKSLYELRKDNNPNWKDDWIPFFDTNNVVEGVLVKERYDALMAYFNGELNP